MTELMNRKISKIREPSKSVSLTRLNAVSFHVYDREQLGYHDTILYERLVNSMFKQVSKRTRSTIRPYKKDSIAKISRGF
jgi:hypothetical protein